MRRWFRNGFGLAWHCLRQKKLGGNFSTLKSHFDSDKFPESAGTHLAEKSVLLYYYIRKNQIILLQVSFSRTKNS